MRKQLATTRECADYLNVSADQLRELVRAGKIPARKVGRLLRFDLDAVDVAITEAAA